MSSRLNYPPDPTASVPGCFYWLRGGTLFGVADGDSISGDQVFEVTAPESQDFLDEIGEQMGKTFKMEDFAGR